MGHPLREINSRRGSSSLTGGAYKTPLLVGREKNFFPAVAATVSTPSFEIRATRAVGKKPIFFAP